MALLCPKMCSRVQELSNESKNTQFGVRTRKLWPREVHNKVQMNSTCRGITVHMSWHHCSHVAALQSRFHKFAVFSPFLGPIAQYIIYTCFLDFFRVRLGWENTHSRVSLTLSLNHLGFVIFVLFTLKEEKNLKKKRMRLSLTNLFNLFPFCISFF